jgi:hypothetical protein
MLRTLHRDLIISLLGAALFLSAQNRGEGKVNHSTGDVQPPELQAAYHI